eukprot:TRINITY_DN5645_c0_g1_i2.p1 TRINITY_DN5645_c0_g1~~TRINITY_DN5645_c0_g1_i2.p1  ORF type:complete len:155 (-),score=35.56 TRINITY_DN5645_c0_g1_i2:24-488(-)
MFCCECEPQVIPSELGKQLSSQLRCIMFGHLLMSLLYFIGVFVLTAFFELFFALMVYITYRTYNFCNLVLYKWILIFSIISSFANLGLSIQFHSYYYNSNGRLHVYKLIIFSIALIFYCTALLIAYRSYKEFKALAITSPAAPGALDCNFLRET